MVTIEDIRVELGRPTTSTLDREQWDAWIDQARYLIGKRLGDIALLDQSDVDYVTLQAVVAHARRPDDATRVDFQVDDASSSRTYSSGYGRVTILPEWWGILDPDLSGQSGVGSTQMFGEPDAFPVESWA